MCQRARELFYTALWDHSMALRHAANPSAHLGVDPSGRVRGMMQPARLQQISRIISAPILLGSLSNIGSAELL